MNLKTIALLSVAALLAGCATTCPPAQVNVPHNIPIPNVQPTPMNLKNVQWKVYTVDQLEAMVQAAKAKGQTNVTFYVLDQDNFNSLAYNLTAMERYIKDQKSQNDYLIRAIEINNGDTPTQAAQTDAPVVTNPQAKTPVQ